MGFSFKSSRHGDYVRVESEPVRTSLDDGTSSVDRLLQKEMPALEYTTSRPWWRRYAPLILVHVFLFVTYSALLFYFTSNIRDLSRHGPSLVASPANEAIFYKERAIPLEPNLGDKPFAARPSPELDANWDELVKYANIEVETEYMRHLGREEIGVRLPDKEDRFLGTLNVYHQLHCVVSGFAHPSIRFSIVDFIPRDVFTSGCIKTLISVTKRSSRRRRTGCTVVRLCIQCPLVYFGITEH